MDIKRFTCNNFYENCYLVAAGNACALIDPGFASEAEMQPLLKFLNGRVPDAILLTHGHFDHTLGVVRLLKLWGSVPVYMGPEDAVVLQDDYSYSKGVGIPDGDFSFPWIPARDGQVLKFGELTFRAIATPGHTPGGICWHCEAEDVLFSGDTLFADSIGRTDFGHGDYDAEIRSIMEKLMILPSDTIVYPGHGIPTTIGRERVSNPFLEPWGGPEELGETLQG